MSQARTVNYEPSGPVTKAFMESKAFIRGIMGPLGSGKSTACVIEILRRAQMQKPSPDGIRRTRWVVIRNSYPELKSTTIKTWAQWCPTEYGRLNQDSPITHHIKTTDLDMEVLFMALDQESDVRKLLSLEVTGGWINEAREVPKSILDALTGRVGRYPSKIEGGATWSGIIMDTNPPDSESWWYKASEAETPDEWAFFKQPSGLSDEAENIKNLPPKYYERLVGGKSEDWLKVYVHGEYGFVTEGKAVYPMYRDHIHCAKETLPPIDTAEISIACDFGLTPAAIIGQRTVDGRWLILDELVADSCGNVRFAELLASHMAKHYPDYQIGDCYGDPAGNQRAQSDERTALEIMNQYTGWKWKPAPSNDPMMRREVVVGALNRLVEGNPGFLLSPKCAMLRKGFAGGYHYRFIQNANGTRFHETPNKNAYSHPHDALQYLLLGGGESNVVLQKVRRGKRRWGDKNQIANGVDYLDDEF